MTLPGDLRDERPDVVSAHHNRRRARAIGALPAVILFGLVALVLTGIGAPTIGLIAGAAAGAALYVSLVLTGSSVLLRALGARRTQSDELARARNLTEGLCASMGLPLPSMWVVDDEAMNAITLGRGPHTAAMVLTSGLARGLDPVELEGLLAHELTHVKRCEIATGTVSAAMLLPIALVASGTASAVHRLAGRGREFRADQSAVGVTRYPPGLRDALSRIDASPAPRARTGALARAALRATRWLWTVAVPLDGAVDPSGDRRASEDLDSASVRIAALDEW